MTEIASADAFQPGRVVARMSDRELLEAAAKAAGIDAEFHPELGCGPEGMWLKGARSPDNSKYWNPLNDGGDALRLAVARGMTVRIDRRAGFSWVKGVEGSVPHGSDPDAATRRAIVRAAAQHGLSDGPVA